MSKVASRCHHERPEAGWRGHARGLTLIELMVTVAVAAVLLTLAAPSFREMIQRNKARSVTNEFNTAVAQARGLAIANNTCVTLCTASVTATNAPTCASPDSTGYQAGWIVFTNPACDGDQVNPVAAGGTLRQTRNGSSDGFSIVPSQTSVYRLMFDARGISTAPADVLFQIRAPGDTGNVYARTICMDATGRTTVRGYTTSCN
jgi:type IV fimbrial biogenesis protein FimT